MHPPKATQRTWPTERAAAEESSLVEVALLSLAGLALSFYAAAQGVVAGIAVPALAPIIDF